MCVTTYHHVLLMKQQRFTMERKVGDMTLEPSHDIPVNQWQHYGSKAIGNLHQIVITTRLNISTKRGPIFLQILFQKGICSMTVSLWNSENTKEGDQVAQFSTELVEVGSKLFGCQLLIPRS